MLSPKQMMMTRFRDAIGSPFLAA
ncbi:hypothetical protein MED222_04925 [Vibrio sp. MED222]|nr:hypothetical protein MED222_04925 [Vibrio sp. MED222]